MLDHLRAGGGGQAILVSNQKYHKLYSEFCLANTLQQMPPLAWQSREEESQEDY